MGRQIFLFLTRLLPTFILEDCYLQAGLDYGEMCSYAGHGVDVGAKWKDAKWARWEAAYAARGFRTITASDFQLAGGYGRMDVLKLRKKREPGEAPVLYAVR